MSSHPKCGICGRFIKLSELDRKDVYDHSGIVDTLFYHKKCLTPPVMSSIKVMFGLQPNHIARIEEHRGLWMMNAESDFDPFYTESFWEELGREFHWHPLTLCLHYFEIKHKTTANNAH